MLYAEDLTPGREFPFGTWTMTEADVFAYAREWDPLPIHTDPEHAASGPHGGVIASGLHTLAVYQRLAAAALWSQTSGVGGRGFQVGFRRPVKPGTTLTGKARIDRVEHRPERGRSVVWVVSQLTGDDGEVVLDITVDAIVFMRPAE
ncbi:MaoC/PaaZ C-terminal domain-containing protein [Patulibacter sp. NPDC049589]|uniref:MaoC/PaaZ C-terminal domain-containing protein n=1 Tax=Patulibacter sp. NPDC049589 TaxID=3154731 RepID=UPI0034211694